MNNEKSVASIATSEFKNLVERFKQEEAFKANYGIILDNTKQVIVDCEEGKISDDVLGNDEVIDLYSILSHFASDQSQDIGMRE